MRRLILLLLSLALLLGLGGCMPYVRQTPEEETTLITVGFSQVGAESDWRGQYRVHARKPERGKRLRAPV